MFQTTNQILVIKCGRFRTSLTSSSWSLLIWSQPTQGSNPENSGPPWGPATHHGRSDQVILQFSKGRWVTLLRSIVVHGQLVQLRVPRERHKRVAKQGSRLLDPGSSCIVGEVVAWFHHIARLAVWRYSDGKNPCLYRQMFHRVSWSHMFMSLEARNRRSQNPRRFFCPKNCSNGVTFRSSSTTLMAWFRALWCVVNGHPSQMEI